jgi:integral membrane protein
MTSQNQAEMRKQLAWMRVVSLLEGSTLVLLVLVSVPLKHLAGFPIATAVMGPIHGMAFVLYTWMLLQTVSGGGWLRRLLQRARPGAPTSGPGHASARSQLGKGSGRSLSASYATDVTFSRSYRTPAGRRRPAS